MILSDCSNSCQKTGYWQSQMEFFNDTIQWNGSTCSCTVAITNFEQIKHFKIILLERWKNNVKCTIKTFTIFPTYFTFGCFSSISINFYVHISRVFCTHLTIFMCIFCALLCIFGTFYVHIYVHILQLLSA